MDKDLLQYLINLSIIIPFFIVIMILSVKLSKSSLNKIQNSRYAQVIEKTSLTKDTNMFVVKTGDEGCVILVSQSYTQKIRDINSEEMAEILSSKDCVKIDRIKKQNFYNESKQSTSFNILPKKILDKESKIWRH